MKVLVLSPYPDYLEPTIVKAGDECISCSATREVSDWPETDMVVSFGYRKIIPERVIKKYAGGIINIHCSVLPFNRGAKPNFWSWFDDTQHGVTIHKITPTLDAGPILAQVVLYEDYFRTNPTLLSTYNDLLVAASGLFARNWHLIKNGCTSAPRDTFRDVAGSYHKEGQEMPFFRCLSKGWFTPVAEVKQLGWLYRKAAK